MSGHEASVHQPVPEVVTEVVADPGRCQQSHKLHRHDCNSLRAVELAIAAAVVPAAPAPWEASRAVYHQH
jgi:hypothetical protein